MFGNNSPIILLLLTVSVLESRAASVQDISLPPGFQIEIFSDAVPGARSMALGENGTLFVGTRNQGVVYGLVDEDADGVSDLRYIIARGLRMPNGIAYHDGALYVAENHRILRYDHIEDRLAAPPEPAVIARLPSEPHHGWRYLAFGPDARLYVSLGAPCNVCSAPGFARILSMDAEGGHRQVVAEGVRNSLGFDWHPMTGELWFTDNGRDWMGDDLPPDELNRAPVPGLHFGFPYCHGGDIPDPRYGGAHPCDEFRPPALQLGAHLAPLGLRFYTGRQFPDAYRQQLFIAEHGSWNRSTPVGYRIVLVRLAAGRPVHARTFAEGWLRDGEAWGRPVDLLVSSDGSLLVSDDKAGAVYRISYGARATTRQRPASAHTP